MFQTSSIKIYLIYLLLLFFTGVVFPADVSLTSTVDKNQVGVNDQFVYTVEVSGTSANLPTPTFPSFENFTILSGPNTSTNIQFINGAMSSSNSYSFYLRPQKEGTFNIEAASLEVDGETISSNTIRMTVAKGTVKPQPQQKSAKSSKDKDLLGENLYLKTLSYRLQAVRIVLPFLLRLFSLQDTMGV